MNHQEYEYIVSRIEHTCESSADVTNPIDKAYWNGKIMAFETVLTMFRAAPPDTLLMRMRKASSYPRSMDEKTDFE